MSRVISQRELRNDSGAIMRALDEGEEFVITRHGVPVGELKPVRRHFVSRDALLAAIANSPHIDGKRFREDVDSILDQSIEPRA
jgi:antitoxin (DNA-binding transcriptional repressor) of toxin-antitoxin stability system